MSAESNYLSELIVGAVTAIAGAIGGIWAEKKAKKSEAMQELVSIKEQYKELNDYTRTELSAIRAELHQSRLAEEDCHKKHGEALQLITKQERRIIELTETVALNMEANGLPKPITRPHNKDLLT